VASQGWPQRPRAPSAAQPPPAQRPAAGAPVPSAHEPPSSCGSPAPQQAFTQPLVPWSSRQRDPVGQSPSALQVGRHHGRCQAALPAGNGTQTAPRPQPEPPVPVSEQSRLQTGGTPAQPDAQTQERPVAHWALAAQAVPSAPGVTTTNAVFSAWAELPPAPA